MSTRKNLTYKEKLKVLEVMEQGELTKAEIAASFSIAMPTLLRIIRTRDSITQLGMVVGGKTRLRQPQYQAIEEQLLVWINELNGTSAKVTGKMIKAQATDISIQMGIFNFPASNGWLDNFRKRYGLNKFNELSEEQRERIVSGGGQGFHRTLKLQSSAAPKRRKVAVSRAEEEEGEEQHIPCDEELEGELEVGDSILVKMKAEPELVYVHEMPLEVEEGEEVEQEGEQTEYLEFAEYTREDAKEAHQILVAYFHSHPAPPGTFLSLQRIGEAIGCGEGEGDQREDRANETIIEEGVLEVGEEEEEEHRVEGEEGEVEIEEGYWE